MAVQPRESKRIGHFRDDGARRRFLAAYDAALARWPAPPKPVDVATLFGTTHVHVSGAATGSPIVLLHGVAVSSPAWFPNIAALGAHHPVYAIDTITDAGRSTQSEPVRDGAGMSRWLDDVLAGLDLDRVHLVGLSYGGWLALNQACRADECVASVTAVDPPGAIGRMKFHPGMVPDVALALAKSDDALDRLLRRMNNGRPLDPQVHDLAVAGLRTFKGKAPFPRRMTDAQLQAVRRPVLLLFGAQSPVTDPARAVARAERLLASVQTEVVPDAGHMLPVDRPEVFDERVLRFVGEVDDRDRGRPE